jgi:hypothetical protein
MTPLKSRRGWRALIRENWYRDVWLLLISAACAFAVASAHKQTNSASMAAGNAKSAAADAKRAAVEAKALTRRIDDATKDNCKRIHRLTHTIDGFLKGSRPRLVQLGREGTLTPAQVKRALTDNTDQRATLRAADCPAPPPKP